MPKTISVEIIESPLILPNSILHYKPDGTKTYKTVKLIEKEISNVRKKKVGSKVSIVDIYTLPGQFEALVESVIITNTTSSNINAFLYYYEGASTTQFLIVNNKQISGNDFLRLDNFNINLSKGDKIQAKTASGSDANILISVKEIFTGLL